MKTLKRVSGLLCLLLILALHASLSAQETKNLAEKLGYPREAKLLIIHADDIGLSHSTNMAVIKALESNSVTSGSLMVPCPWFPEIADYLRNHPGLDIGIHATLTSEWKFYKWGGVLPSDQIPSLLDKNGNFFASTEELGKAGNATEVEKELRAQVEKAIAYGIQPTHIDTHMGSVLAKPDFIKAYLKIAREYHIPMLMPSIYLGMMPPDIKQMLGPDVVAVDNLFMLEPQMIKGEWSAPYMAAIAAMKPGLNEMIVHLSVDNAEMQAITVGHDDYGSAWRQHDLDLVTGDSFKKALADNHIILVTWRQIRDLINSERK